MWFLQAKQDDNRHPQRFFYENEVTMHCHYTPWYVIDFSWRGSNVIRFIYLHITLNQYLPIWIYIHKLCSQIGFMRRWEWNRKTTYLHPSCQRFVIYIATEMEKLDTGGNTSDDILSVHHVCWWHSIKNKLTFNWGRRIKVLVPNSCVSSKEWKMNTK